MNRITFFKKLSLVLAVVTLVLGFLPLPLVGRVGTIYADSTTEQTEETSNDENNPDNTVEVTDNSGTTTDENSQDGASNGEESDNQDEDQNPSDEEQAPEIQSLSMSLSSLSVSSAIGDDPNVQNELPNFGTNYSNGDCVTNNSCETAEPVTNPNAYSDQGTYGEKDYALPDIDGNEANIVAIKEGNQWYFFKKGSGETCVESTFCVEFDNSGNVQVYSYQTQANGYKGYNMIHFWYADDSEEDIPGCMDTSALNYDPSATVDNGSCQYNEEVYGCTDVSALNYDPNATLDDESCQYEEEVYGCTDPQALNYDPNATLDDQTCEYEEDDPGDPGNPGGGGGTTTTLLIPVTAPQASGPDEELLVIPVTGVDLDMELAGFQKMFRYISLMLFGVTMVLGGISRKFRF